MKKNFLHVITFIKSHKQNVKQKTQPQIQFKAQFQLHKVSNLGKLISHVGNQESNFF